MKPIFMLFATLALTSSPLMSEEQQRITLPAIAENAKHPEKVRLELMSKDPTYGYSDQNPIRVGPQGDDSRPKAERQYLYTLLDSAGKAITYKRLFSGGKDPKRQILDCYEVQTSTGEKVRLWISMYEDGNKPEDQPAPVGFYKRQP